LQAEESDDILEHHEFSITENMSADLMKEPLVTTTKQFLEANINPSNSHTDLVISLSGGVDSMVIAKILSILLPTVQCRKLVAMHIDYANREESSREAAFVEEWAARHGFEVHVRIVDEVTRGVTSRSDYEKISRQIRYGFYKDVLSLGGWAGDLAASGVGVVFGHHVGDIQENVISNIMR
jgi:tRNA(Ile)-lysidine synthase TilS/MesJ